METLKCLLPDKCFDNHLPVYVSNIGSVRSLQKYLRQLQMIFLLKSKHRAFQGPHSTCCMSAETYVRRHLRQGQEATFHTSQRTIVALQIQFMLYFSSAILSMLGLLIFSTLFICGYILTRISLRAQFKLTVLLLLLQRQPFSFKHFNDFVIRALHIIMLLVGGFGYLTLLFVSM